MSKLLYCKILISVTSSAHGRKRKKRSLRCSTHMVLNGPECSCKVRSGSIVKKDMKVEFFGVLEFHSWYLLKKHDMAGILCGLSEGWPLLWGESVLERVQLEKSMSENYSITSQRRESLKYLLVFYRIQVALSSKENGGRKINCRQDRWKKFHYQGGLL